jgi:hypothetical protein
MTQFLNQSKREIIWIDKNINNSENQGYLNSSMSGQNLYIPTSTFSKIYNIKEFSDIDSAINFVKILKFIEVIIIVSGSLFKDFIQEIKNILPDIYNTKNYYFYN